MSKCINCGRDNEGRSKYCDNTCKTQYIRALNKADGIETVTDETVISETVSETVSLEQSMTGLASGITDISLPPGTHPYSIMHQLRQAGQLTVAIVTKPVRSRTEGCKVAIPGDEDYVGVCHNVGGVWKVGEFGEQLPPKDMNRQELSQAIRAYPNDQWVNSPEYKELKRRLVSRSVEQLEAEGYDIPAWKRAAA